MPNTVVFLWISAAASGAAPGLTERPPGSLRADTADEVGSVRAAREVAPTRALSALRDFGAARGLSFVAVSQGRPLGLRSNDAELVDALEGELEQARTSLSALEEANADLRLSQVEAQLLAHPHLPQASFLMAECLALQAQAARATSPNLAAELEAGRMALEGPRAPAFGEVSSAPVVLATTELELRGLSVSDELELDGVRWPAPVTRVALAPGLHHARVWRGARPIFATFVRASVEQTTLSLDVPARVPCSAEDLEGVSGAGAAPPDGRVAQPLGITCPQWARVREQGNGIAISLCQRSQCGPFQPWQQRGRPPFAPIAAERRGFPAWAGFALAGGAALIASGIVLWQSGAFERGRPTSATWQYGGLNPQGIPF